MKRVLWASTFLLAAAFGGSGCGDSYLNEEMHLGDEEKIRPIAVVVEPAEAAPGETLTVTMLWHDPGSAGASVQWRVALDYDEGLYGTEPVEADFLDLASVATIPDPSDDGQGFREQTFTFTIPDRTLRDSSSLSGLLDEDLLETLREALAPGSSPDAFGQGEIDAFLASLEPEDLTAMEPEERELVLELSDLFACRIRLRATLSTDLEVDVTRTVTVRHAGRLGSSNANANPTLDEWAVVGFDHPDLEWRDRETLDVTTERWTFPAGDPQGEVRVPRRDGWTYYVVVGAVPETYSSPFSGGSFDEQLSQRWYWFWNDDPTNGFALFRSDTGDETEMWDLDESVRIQPPGGAGGRFRVVAIVRDERPEWEQYSGTSGATIAIGEIVFE